MDFNDMCNDQQYMEALDNIIENRMIFQKVLFSNQEWINEFVSQIDATNWAKVDVISGNAPLSCVICVTDDKNATPVHILTLICTTIANTLADGRGLTDFGRALIETKAHYCSADYITRYHWLAEYMQDPSKIGTMFNILPLMGGMFDIRF